MNLASLKKVELSGDCPICLGAMDEPKKIVITKCSHAFHEQCMTFLLDMNERKSCPYCTQMPVPMVRAEELPDDSEKNPYIQCKMLRALREKDINYINAALLNEPHLIDKPYKYKKVEYPLLALAAKFGHRDIVASLLNKVKKESIDAFSSNGLTALSAACLFKHTEVVELLLGAGAKVNNTNFDGKNALWFAACAGKKDILALLVKFGSFVTNKTEEGFTALFIAAQNGHSEAVDYLISVIPKEELEAHINICSSSTTTATALYMAAQDGYTDIVSSLLLAGADPNQVVGFGQIPLHIAAAAGHVEMVKLLLARGTDVNCQASNGATALGYAAANGRREICECLLKANADPHLGYEKILHRYIPIYLNPSLGYDEKVSREQVGAADIARKNGHIELADYIKLADRLATYRRWYLKLLSWKK